MYVCVAVYCVLQAELMVYLTKIIQGLVAGVCVYAVYCVLEAELLVYLTKIIQGLVASVRVCCCVLCVGGRTLGVSDQDYPRADGRCSCVLLCTVCWRQSAWCI